MLLHLTRVNDVMCFKHFSSTEISFQFCCSLRNWRDLARECFCFGSEAVNASGDPVRGLVKSLRRSQIRLRGNWRLRRRSPAHESRQLGRLVLLQNGIFIFCL